MLLGGINIPEALLTAHEERRLVIFTGAGISIAPPSDLCSFLELCAQVAAKLQSSEDPNSPEWKPQLDAFMGNLDDDETADVHRLVKGIITVPTSRPNTNHEALARIAAKGTARVVTTNYDLHLEHTLRQQLGDALEVFRAPAMPLGDNFTGLVYLHGSADSEAERFVVTDRDFSKAYFHSAWAARFLERMFSRYVVLFIGYSHSDVVMKYLGLGLGPRAERYVITDDPTNQIWERLRVKVLDYPAKQHQVLTECLTEWADLTEMGLLEHRQRIRNIVSNISPSEDQSIDLLTTPAELSYLRDSIRRADRVGFFCEFASDPGWLEWARKEEPFGLLFDRTHPWDEVTTRLAWWFAKTFAYGDEEVSKKAWTTFADAGGVLGTTLWNALAGEMHRYQDVRPPHVLRWLWVLLEQEHIGCDLNYLKFALEMDGVWEDRELSLAILEHLTAPRLEAERGWGSARIAVETRGDLYWLDKAWTERFLPELDTLVLDVFPAVERALTRHLALEKRAGRYLGFSWRRPAIRAHENDQHHHRDTIDAVIDAVRDCIERLWLANPDYARQVIDRWMTTDHALLKRLAVHGISDSPTLGADAKLRFVLDHDLAGNRDTAPEVFHLFATSAKDASPEVIDDLVTAFAPLTEELADQFRAFTAYEILERAGVTSDRLNDALGTIRAAHDDFEPDEHPGMTGAIVVSWSEDKLPLSTDDLDAKVKDNPAEAIQYILNFEEKVVPSGSESTRDDAISMLRSTVQRRPSAGLELWPHLGNEEALHGAIISAWGHATDPDDMRTVVAALLDTDLKTYNHQIGQFLLHASRATDVHWEEVSGVDDFIEGVWQACETDEEYTSTPDRDWLSETINVTVGHLLEFWFRVFHRRWAAAGDDWTGLPNRDRAFLDRALADPTKRGAHALTQIASRLAYLDQADTTWCRQQLLPLRDWANPHKAEPFWWGVLSYGRWTSGLAADGLIDGLVETGKHLDAFTEDQARRWAGFLASIAVRCEAPTADTWVDTFTSSASPKDRERWIDALADELAAIDEPASTATWTKWLHAYWAKRIHDNPVVFEKAEMDAFASVAPHTPHDALETAVSLVEATQAAFDSYADASRYVSEDLIDAQPEAVGRLYTHLMNNTALPFYGTYELRPKLERLVKKPGDWATLKAAAFRLGIDLT
jgi:hypothetical protein